MRCNFFFNLKNFKESHLSQLGRTSTLDHPNGESKLATTACSLALQTENDPEITLKVLKQGREVILRLFMNDQNDIFELKAVYSELYARYENFRLKMNKPVENITNDKTRKIVFTNRTKTFAELEKCVQHIQQLFGFSYFHKNLTVKQMQSCSTTNSIVVVTSLISEVMLLLLLSTRSLFDLSAGQVKNWIVRNFTTTSLYDRGRKNRVYLQFLSWLWHECVSPVLDELQCYVQPSAGSTRRTKWYRRITKFGSSSKHYEIKLCIKTKISASKNELFCNHKQIKKIKDLKVMQAMIWLRKNKSDWSFVPHARIATYSYKSDWREQTWKRVCANDSEVKRLWSIFVCLPASLIIGRLLLGARKPQRFCNFH